MPEGLQTLPPELFIRVILEVRLLIIQCKPDRHGSGSGMFLSAGANHAIFGS
jgi:hypothetical protein